MLQSAPLDSFELTIPCFNRLDHYFPLLIFGASSAFYGVYGILFDGFGGEFDRRCI